MSRAIDLHSVNERADLVFMARAAESAERFDDMCTIMKKLVHMKQELTDEERNLLSVAYKNSIGVRRAAWRALRSEEYKGKQVIVLFEKHIEPEFNGLCNEISELLTSTLIAGATNSSAKVFYNKMAGDYARYQAEFQPDDTKYGQAAKDFYETATQVAHQNLHPTDPIRLGLALNYSVCYFEVLKEPEKAINNAKTAFDDAIKKLDGLDESSYKDATAILQLIRDNLTLWNQGAEENSAEEAVAVDDVIDPEKPAQAAAEAAPATEQPAGQ